MALAALGSIPDEIYDAAILEASSHWQVLRHVGLPLAWPVLTVAILLRLIEGLKSFGLPFALTSGGPGTSTQLFSIMNYLITTKNLIRGRVEVVEPQGSTTIIQLSVGIDIRLIALINEQVELAPGSALALSVASGAIHLFNPDTDQSV